MKKIFKITLVILWMTLIFCFSNQKADDSSKISDGLIKSTICKINNTDCEIILDNFVKPVRKSAHFLIYFVLGLLVLNSFNNDKKYLVYSIIICFLYSITDEVHQIFVVGRSAEVLDVLIDTTGSSLGVLLLHKIRHKSR